MNHDCTVKRSGIGPSAVYVQSTLQWFATGPQEDFRLPAGAEKVTFAEMAKVAYDDTDECADLDQAQLDKADQDQTACAGGTEITRMNFPKLLAKLKTLMSDKCTEVQMPIKVLPPRMRAA